MISYFLDIEIANLIGLGRYL